MKLKTDGSSRYAVIISSVLFMGLAHLLFFKQYIKGAFFALVHAVVLVFLPALGRTLHGMITLGEAAPHLPVAQRDHSTFMLIEGVAVLAILALFICVYVMSVRSAVKTYKGYCETGRLAKSRDGVKELVNQAFPVLGLSPAVLLVMFFVVVPLVFAVLVSFTNYSSPHNLPPGNTVDWVGLENYARLFGGETLWAGALARVAIWTVIWALLATATCYMGGMLMAVILKDRRMPATPLFRMIFILPYAVPSVISMLVWRNLLNGQFGAINLMLIQLGIIDSGIPWLTSEWLVRFTVVLVNLWAGFPYFMLLTMGSMTAIDVDMFNAAKIDGASRFGIFRHITFPLVTFQTMPLIIMSFTHNINNFGAIFFLTGGHPMVRDTPQTGATGVDILVTWIYRLTMETQQFNLAAVLAVMLFVFLAPFAVFQFMRTKSFKEGEL